jgi:hypothetical protein
MSITSSLAESFHEYWGLRAGWLQVARISGNEVARISGTHTSAMTATGPSADRQVPEGLVG